MVLAIDLSVLSHELGILDEVVKAGLGRSLTEIQRGIEDTLEPASGSLEGWRIRGTTAIERVTSRGRNVLGLLAGKGRKAGPDSPAIDPATEPRTATRTLTASAIACSVIPPPP